jgi:hypothetical protein
MQDKVMESVRMPEVMDSGTFGLGTTFLKCRAIRSAGLKELYCNLISFSIYTQVFSRDGYVD